MRRPFGSLGLAILGFGLASLPAHPAMAAGFTYKVLAFLDTKAPGGGQLVNDFEPSAITGEGEVAFVVDYDQEDSEALYLASGGKLITIVEPGRPAVDDWTFVADGPIGMILSPVGMNAAGDISFGCDIQKKGSTDITSGNFLWQRKTGKLVAVSLPGTDAPGGGQFGLTKRTWTDVNDQGDVVFSAAVPDSAGNEDQGVFIRLADGTTRSIARPGDKMPEGQVLNRARRPSLSNAGAVAFEGQYAADGNNHTGVFLSANNTMTVLALPDGDAPGGGKFTEAKNAHMNNQGEVVLLGHTDAGWGVYRWANNALSAVVRPGDNLRDGAKLKEAAADDASQALSDSGNLAMRLELEGDADGIYLLRGTELEVVARSGSDLPGVGSLDNVEGDYIAVNNLGQVSFQAKLKDDRTALVLATPNP